MRRLGLCIAAMAAACVVRMADAEGLTASRLGLIYNSGDPSSTQVARYYAARRGVPADNVVDIVLPDDDRLDPLAFLPIRRQVLDRLPGNVQSLVLVWSKPFAVGCMSITTAFAAGYRPQFCSTGCGLTLPNPLFDSEGWLPADTVGWWPAMLIPSRDIGLAEALIDRGIRADGSHPDGTLYLVRTPDVSRNVRARTYIRSEMLLGDRLRIDERIAPVDGEMTNAIGYFTGAVQVEEMTRIRFLAGAVADHLTSYGGVLDGSRQMSLLRWLAQGATASYGAVSEPCGHPEKFPDIAVFFQHYLRGDTVLEAYWKSVRMPGQGLFVGEPLARPFGSRTQ